jgi:hypothetical protein
MRATLLSIALFLAACGGVAEERRDALGAYATIAERIRSRLPEDTEPRFRRSTPLPTSPVLTEAEAAVFAAAGWEELDSNVWPVPDTTARVLTVAETRERGDKLFVSVTLAGVSLVGQHPEFWQELWGFEFRCLPTCRLLSEVRGSREEAGFDEAFEAEFLDSLAARSGRRR